MLGARPRALHGHFTRRPWSFRQGRRARPGPSRDRPPAHAIIGRGDPEIEALAARGRSLTDARRIADEAAGAAARAARDDAGPQASSTNRSYLGFVRWLVAGLLRRVHAATPIATVRIGG